MRSLTKTTAAIACLSAIACCFSMTEAVFAKDPQPNCQSAQTQLDLNICAGLAAKAADRNLNETYQRLKNKYRNCST
ncbi:lysozyme inhibitor LprI family protein [Tumidithrix elongata RA019]|uniref:Lysozyme inhibitor LprI family protein n=1 Tax=Tumidithrix elongata BACA0141 TaxID=2716417 RepID=A0AAW9Q2A6_9CYAN|nr:lysozyme inhibitor LprI family protein [Tumidithrix elongata RA019]